MVKQRKRYSEKTINESIALYESGESIDEINRAFGLTPTTIYSFLKSRGIPTRQQKERIITNNHIASDTSVKPAVDLVLTTDKEGWVIGAENKAALKGPVFVVEFSGFLEISANSFEEALATARKREIVKRIHSIRER